MTVAAQTSKKNTVAVKTAAAKTAKTAKKAEVKAVEQKKEAVRAEKQRSNTQRCADMIIALARDAKSTRQEIVAAVSDAITALSVVTVKTMLSDLHNVKYARRYADHTIKTDRETKKVTLDKAIV